MFETVFDCVFELCKLLVKIIIILNDFFEFDKLIWLFTLYFTFPELFKLL